MDEHDHNWDAAMHEASHLAMRRWIGLPATRVTIEGGVGYCEGSGERCSKEESVLVSLAGVAYEHSICPDKPLPDQGDIDEENDVLEMLEDEPSDELSAWREIESYELLRTTTEMEPDGVGVKIIRQTVQEAFARHLQEASDILKRLQPLVEMIAKRLYAAKELSAAEVAEIWQEWEEQSLADDSS